MWKHLLDIHEESLLNAGQPACSFAETLIFNEGWLLRSVLQAWKTQPPRSALPFLPFPEDTKVYSEGQLFTPFRARTQGDSEAETNARLDGIAGHFSIAHGTKSGIVLVPDCRYVAVFEAKLYSPIGKGTKKAPEYDQVSRTAACLIHALLQANATARTEAHIVVLYPEDNPAIVPGAYAKADLRERIRKRLEGYTRAGGSTPEIIRFEAGWEEALGRLEVHFEAWERVLDELKDGELDRFYGLCREFNGPSQ